MCARALEEKRRLENKTEKIRQKESDERWSSRPCDDATAFIAGGRGRCGRRGGYVHSCWLLRARRLRNQFFEWEKRRSGGGGCRTANDNNNNNGIIVVALTADRRRVASVSYSTRNVYIGAYVCATACVVFVCAFVRVRGGVRPCASVLILGFIFPLVFVPSVNIRIRPERRRVYYAETYDV